MVGGIDIKCSRAWLQRILKIETLDFNDDGTGEVGARVYYKKEKWQNSFVWDLHCKQKRTKKRRKKIAALIIYYTFARCYILLFCSFYCACEGVYERSSVCLMLFLKQAVHWPTLKSQVGARTYSMVAVVTGEWNIFNANNNGIELWGLDSVEHFHCCNIKAILVMKVKLP